MRNIQEQCKTKPLDCDYKIFILDEVHMITLQGWNSMLKILEEPPEYVIFLFATTDPQKIIGTIMSRVQRFNFKRISIPGVVNRLKFIIESENKLNQPTLLDTNLSTQIKYEESSLQYIARLSKGGMRDAITTLEKCIDYSTDLTLENVLKVTSGGISEQTLLHLLDLLLNKQCKESLLYYNDIYMSGIDTTLFLKLFIEFLENCVKYLIVKSSDIVTVSDLVIEYLLKNEQHLESMRAYLFSLLNLFNRYSSEDLKVIIESWIVKVCI